MFAAIAMPHIVDAVDVRPLSAAARGDHTA